MEIYWMAIAGSRLYQIHIYCSFHHGFSSYHVVFFPPGLWSSLLLIVSVWWGLADWRTEWGFSWPASIPPRHSFLQCPVAAGLAAYQRLWQEKEDDDESGAWRRSRQHRLLSESPGAVTQRASAQPQSHSAILKLISKCCIRAAGAHYWSSGPGFTSL